jgi:hypothetical protein
MGEGFMVVVSIEDMLCKRCGALLNHLDKLESDLDIVKQALTGYLKVKYGLLEGNDDQTEHQKQNIASEVKGMIYTNSLLLKLHFFQIVQLGLDLGSTNHGCSCITNGHP